jgi:tetratricopeptide (TPR) repeat protein
VSMAEHPVTEVLGKFSQGRCTVTERQQVVRHLLAGCSSCGSAIRDLLTGAKAVDSERSLEATFDRVFSRVQREIPARQQAQALLDSLTALPPEQRLDRVLESPEFQDHAFCRLLIRAGEDATNGDPERMLHFSCLATVVADRLEAQAGALEAPQLADLRGEAWTHYANALRVTGRLREAERAFATAERHLASGTGDLRLSAGWMRQRSSLLSHQRRFAPAILLVKQAAEVFRELGERREVGRCLLKQAIFTGYGGSPDEALCLIGETLRWIDHDRELTRQAIHAAARFAIDADRPEEGMVMLVDNRDLLERDAPPVALARLTWLYGEMFHALGLHRVAESHLRRARRELSELRMPYEVALVCLELAKIYCEDGREKELHDLARRMLPTFESLQVRRETLASIMLLQHGETASALRLVGRIASELRQRLPVRRSG